MTNNGHTRAHTWKSAAQEGVLLVLPSGNEMVVKEVDLIALILEGGSEGIPEPLVNVVTRRFEPQGTPANGDGASEAQLGMEVQQYLKNNLPDLGKFINRVVKAAALSPRLVDKDANPDNDEILLARLAMSDRVYIFERVLPNREAAAAGDYLRQPGTGVDAVRAGEDVSPKSERDPGADE